MEQILNSISSPEPGSLKFGQARMALIDIESGFWNIRRAGAVLHFESKIGEGIHITLDIKLNDSGKAA